MSKKRARSGRSYLISPINPSLHFVIFLVLAFILVIFVAFVMQQTSKSARARLFCPQSMEDPVELIQQMAKQCPDGVEYVKDNLGCNVLVCKTPAL